MTVSISARYIESFCKNGNLCHFAMMGFNSNVTKRVQDFENIC